MMVLGSPISSPKTRLKQCKLAVSCRAATGLSYERPVVPCAQVCGWRAWWGVGIN